MAVNVRIKQKKSLFNKVLNIDDIIKLTNLSYGTADDNFRIVMNEKGTNTLLYDENKLARGIDVSFDNNDIILYLNLPTTKSEIKLYYDVIEKICNKLKVKSYIRENEEVVVEGKADYIKLDVDASTRALSDLYDKLTSSEYTRFELFGIYNPISIGVKEIEEIDANLNNLEKFLHEKQVMDVYYATPRVYEVKGRLVGLYAIGPNIPSVAPTEPYIVLNRIEGVNEWYVMTEGCTIKYDDFFNNVKSKEYYDFNHVVLTATPEEIESICKNYSVEL